MIGPDVIELFQEYISARKIIHEAYVNAEEVTADPTASREDVQDAWAAVERLEKSRETFDLFFRIDTLMYDYSFAGESEIRTLVRALMLEAGDDPVVLGGIATMWREHIEQRFDIRNVHVLQLAAARDKNFQNLLDSWDTPSPGERAEARKGSRRRTP